MRATIILLALSLAVAFSSCQEKKKKPTLTQQKVAVAPVAKPQQEVQPEPEIAEEPVKEINYYLVAGCFKIRSNAEHLNAKLVNEGYDSQILPFYNMSMVTYEGFTTREEAQVALNRIVREPGKELTWVYPVR